MENTKTNRLYKDRLFCAIFGREENRKHLLSLYNAVNNSNYTDINSFEWTTLDNAVYINMNNDVSFLFDNQMHLYEHQATFNPNMPLRGLIYFGQLYTKYMTAKGFDFYSHKQQKIPTPNFIIFYNGTKETEDVVKFKLSDAFTMNDNSGEFEWTATMYNINSHHNKNLLEKCPSLHDYAEYVNMIRSNLKNGMNQNEAVNNAMEVAVKKNFADGFFKLQRSEVLSMSLTECDMEEFWANRRREAEEEKREAIAEGLAEGRKEGIAEGRKEGIAEGLAEGAHNKAVETAKKLFEKNMTAEEIAEITGLSIEEVTSLK